MNSRVPKSLMVSGIVLFLAHASFYWFTCDDAYISFRYARHWVEGRGLVFNIGEHPPVEGFSNGLWVVYLALCAQVGWALEWAANCASVLCGVALLISATRWVERAAGALPALGALFFMALSPTLALWSSSGLETMAYTAALFCALRTAAHGQAWLAGVAALAAAWLRVDGLGFALLALFLGAYLAPAAQRQHLWRSLAVLLLGFAALLAWRLSYFGEWLPNTAFAKSSFSMLSLERGLRYWASYALSLPSVAIAALAVLWILVRGAWRTQRLALVAFVFFAATQVHGILVGGDFMPMGRFFAPGIALLALSFAVLLREHPALRPLALLCLALAPLPSFNIECTPRAWREALHFRWNDPRYRSERDQWSAMRQRSQEWLELGRALQSHTKPGESIILGNIGAIGYASEIFIHDRYGLVDREVARLKLPAQRASAGHDKGVRADYFFPRKPTYLGAWIAPAQELPDAQQVAALRALPGVPELELLRFPLEDATDRALFLWRLNWPR